MKVLILAAGRGDVDIAEGGYPLSLTEFDGMPLIERLINEVKALTGSDVIVVLRADEISRFHLDQVVRLVDEEATIIRVESDTRGGACSALLAIDEIDNDEELLIVNGNELIDSDFKSMVSTFRSRGYAAGTAVFPSIHPRYSYVRLNDEGLVTEAAEKRPISRHATMGFYWFEKGRDFVEAAKENIRNGDSVGGAYFVCPTLNQLILQDRPVGVIAVPTSQFHPLKSERQISSFGAQENRTGT